MALPVNPKNINWLNPTTATAANGNTVPWNANTDLAGIQIDLDSQPAVSVPLAFGANTFQINSLSAYQGLSLGTHNVAIAVVTVEGAVSPESNIVQFLIDVVPFAPTNLVLS